MAAAQNKAGSVEESVLSDDLLRQLINVGEVDLLVAVPTYNRAKTIGQVVRAVRLGLLKSFPRERAALVVVDGGSRDETVELALQSSMTLPADAAVQSLRTFHTVTANYSKNDGQSPLRLLFATADLLQAKACAVISPSEHVTPEWIGRLLAPAYKKSFDFVAPLYRRHRFEGLLVRTLLYPMVRALSGKRVREPYSADFGFSRRVSSEFLLNDSLWKENAGEIGEELLLNLSVMTAGYPLCEVFLGTKEEATHSTDLVEALRQTVGTLFSFVDRNLSRWENAQNSEPVPLEGEGEGLSSESLRVNPHRMYTMFKNGVGELQPVLSSVLSEKTLGELTHCANLGKESFCFPDELWATTLYEFAASYHHAVISRDHIIQALAPLYRGKSYEFQMANRHADPSGVEARIEELCVVFERLKPHLFQLWNRRGGGTT
ncbi:MAG TPA: glycosyltransferase [Terriglobales bacterium]